MGIPGQVGQGASGEDSWGDEAARTLSGCLVSLGTQLYCNHLGVKRALVKITDSLSGGRDKLGIWD